MSPFNKAQSIAVLLPYVTWRQEDSPLPHSNVILTILRLLALQEYSCLYHAATVIAEY